MCFCLKVILSVLVILTFFHLLILIYVVLQVPTEKIQI